MQAGDDSTTPTAELVTAERDTRRRIGIENRSVDHETRPGHPNRTILAFARLVREALEAEDEATQQGA